MQAKKYLVCLLYYGCQTITERQQKGSADPVVSKALLVGRIAR